jgi:homocitrate synthase
MCPHTEGDALPSQPSEMVEVPLNEKRGTSAKVNGFNGHTQSAEQTRNPYAPRPSDFLSNVSNFNIIESTLRGR